MFVLMLLFAYLPIDIDHGKFQACSVDHHGVVKSRINEIIVKNSYYQIGKCSCASFLKRASLSDICTQYYSLVLFGDLL